MIRVSAKTVAGVPSYKPTTLSLIRRFQHTSPSSYDAFHLKPLTGSLGAEIKGVQLAGKLTSSEVAQIRHAFNTYSVLVFRDQSSLSDQDMLKVVSLFGKPEERPVVKGRYGLPMIHSLARESGAIGKYGEKWHHDCSYMQKPPLGALLYGVEVPPYGNDTIFSSMYLAFDVLSPGMKEMLSSLRAVHTAFKYVQKDQVADQDGNHYLPYDQVDHPVIRTHPETGKRALFVNKFFTTQFVGMTAEESQPILEYLFSVVNRPELQCRVSWQPATLTLWDNRCTQHMAIQDHTEHRRVMRRAEIQGEEVPKM